jgi:protein TonB
MTVVHGFTIDCTQISSQEMAGKDCVTIDLCEDAIDSCNHRRELLDCIQPEDRGKIDLPLPEYVPHADMPEHPFPDRRIWANSPTEFEKDLLSIDPDAANRLLSRRFDSRSAKPTAFFTSAAVHGAFFFALVLFPAPHVGGTFGYSGDVVSATIVSHEELIPQDESPASIDSPASMPSIAKKSTKLKEPAPVPPEKPVDMQETGPHPTEIAMMQKPETPEKEPEKKEREREIPNPNEDPAGDGLQNTVASSPSTASAERRFVAAAGRGGEAFDSLVLSAIREAIFFPKQAAQERRHGEVAVAFSITRDGSIVDLRIKRSSGIAILDEAGMKIVQNASKKFPPFPDGVSTDALSFVVPILFKKKGPESS